MAEGADPDRTTHPVEVKLGDHRVATHSRVDNILLTELLETLDEGSPVMARLTLGVELGSVSLGGFLGGGIGWVEHGSGCGVQVAGNFHTLLNEEHGGR